MMAPIVLFVYNRPEHTKRTIEALLRNKEAGNSDLFIFADGPKTDATEEQLSRIQQVRDYIQTIEGFKSISIEQSKKNKGLASSIISGVTKIVNQYGKVIVLEDDIVASHYFLHYMNQSLTLYENDFNVWCINSACYIKNAPISEHTYFLYGADCQGWGTWKQRWECFNSNAQELMNIMKRDKKSRDIFTFSGTYPYMEMLQEQIDGKIDSWAIRWYASAVLQKGLCLYPTKSLVQNIGFDSEGIHTQNGEAYEATIMADDTTEDFPKIRIEDSKVMRKEWKKLYREMYPTRNPSFIKRVKRRLKKLILYTKWKHLIK